MFCPLQPNKLLLVKKCKTVLYFLTCEWKLTETFPIVARNAYFQLHNQSTPTHLTRNSVRSISTTIIHWEATFTRSKFPRNSRPIVLIIIEFFRHLTCLFQSHHVRISLWAMDNRLAKSFIYYTSQSVNVEADMRKCLSV